MTPEEQHHRDLRERLGAYALDGLDAPGRAEVDAHLAGCAACRAELAAIAPLAGPLREVDPDAADDPGPAPAPTGFDDVLRRVREEEAGVVALPARPRPRRTGLLVAAGAVLVALAGLGGGYELGRHDAAGPREAVAVQTLAAGVEADAATIDHTWGVEVVLTARGLDPGRPYRVAVVDRTGRAVGAGTFLGTGPDGMECRLNSSVPPGEATGFVVTTGQGLEVLRSRFV